MLQEHVAIWQEQRLEESYGCGILCPSMQCSFTLEVIVMDGNYTLYYFLRAVT